MLRSRPYPEAGAGRLLELCQLFSDSEFFLEHFLSQLRGLGDSDSVVRWRRIASRVLLRSNLIRKEIQSRVHLAEPDVPVLEDCMPGKEYAWLASLVAMTVGALVLATPEEDDYLDLHSLRSFFTTHFLAIWKLIKLYNELSFSDSLFGANRELQ